ncbi:pyridoxamine 5'-phosphate oxidase family protein [soil metagenome]
MDATKSATRDLNHIARLMKQIDFCMLTTIGQDGSLHSRPMSTNHNVDFDGDLWFFTYSDTPKCHEVAKNPQVSVTFEVPEDHVFISASGKAHLHTDKAKISELWDKSLEMWFPQGINTPGVALLHVQLDRAELWEDMKDTEIKLPAKKRE